MRELLPTFEIPAKSCQFIDPSEHFWVGKLITVRRLENQRTGNTDEKRLPCRGRAANTLLCRSSDPYILNGIQQNKKTQTFI